MKRYKHLISIALVLTMIVSMNSAFACTVMAVGKDASADGSVMVTHTCDGWYDHRIQIVPGGTHAAGEMVDIYRDPCTATKSPVEKVGEIPQVEKTYTYYNIGYPFMNDQQVMMGEFTWSGRDEVSCPNGLFVIANLEMLGLQRAATAREAIQVMGALAEQYGYCDGGETLAVADENEVWIFEVCGGGMLWQEGSDAPGAHWAAQRVPDDQAFVGANRSRIGVIDFNDTENFMWSTDITALPEQMGWWKQGEEFNFNKIFNPEPYGYPFYASRREWRVFSLMAPSQTFEIIDRYEQYPFSIVPDEKLSVQDLMTIYRDHLEGTDYDLTKGLAAGPFGNPHRWSVSGSQKPEAAAAGRHDWERAISLYRCSYSFVAQSRSWMPDPVGGVLWFGEDCPDTTVYVPIYCGATEVPEAWATGERDKFDPTCAWWAFNFVNNWATLRWDAMYADIQAKQAAYENEFFAKQAEIEAEAVALYEQDPAKAVEYVTKYTNDNMNMVEDGWWDFAWELVGKYNDGMAIQADGSNPTLGYPTEWLEEVGYGETSIRDYAITSGEAPAEPTPTPDTTAPAEPTPTPAPADTGSNTSTIVVVAIIAVAVIAVVVFMMTKKKK